MDVAIGTSGWHYDDWVGAFYPRSLAKRRDDWFAHYAEFFPTVEVNSTFYALPAKGVAESWARKAKQFPGFFYSVKVPQTVTHDHLVQGNIESALNVLDEFKRNCVDVLARAGCLGSVLFQMSPYFQRSASNPGTNVRLMESAIGALDPAKNQISVELRHKSWLDGASSLGADITALFRKLDAAPCSTDGPGFVFLENNPATHGYIRLHGRNADMWFTRERSDTDRRMNRYDYVYSERELRELKEKIQRAAGQGRRTLVYFNNHPRGNAPRNALSMMDLFSIPHRELKLQESSQHPLEEFF